MEIRDQIKKVFEMLEAFAMRRFDNRRRLELAKETKLELGQQMQERRRIVHEWYVDYRRQMDNDLIRRNTESDERTRLSEQRAESRRTEVLGAHRARRDALADILRVLERETNG